MDLKANYRVRIKPNQVVHIRRTISGKGSLKVSKNQEVTPDDIIGVYIIEAGFSAVNLAKELGVSPSEALRYLKVPIGRTIFKGELLAYKKGFFSEKIITAPTDGLIDEYNPKSGELRMKFLTKELPLASGVFGKVDSVDNARGEVTIRTLVTQVYGVFGSGIERSGILHHIGGSSSLVSGLEIKPGMSKQVIIGGALAYGEALRKAAVVGISGIICGGFNLNDYISIVGSLNAHSRLGTDVGISLMATEGFGLLPIGNDIFELTKQYSGRYVFINGNLNQLLLPSANSDSILTVRKTALPILPLSKVPAIKPDLTIVDIKIGDRVRIIWPPFMGAQGRVTSIDKKVTVIESGISTYLLTVETPRQMLKVPFTNVEVITVSK